MRMDWLWIIPYSSHHSKSIQIVDIRDSELANIRNYTPRKGHWQARTVPVPRLYRQAGYITNGMKRTFHAAPQCRRFLNARDGFSSMRKEDGVSGHKVRADRRDSIQVIKELAKASSSISSCFMFDRIGNSGRNPVCRWAVCKEPHQVWSTQEGEQRFDNHTDKLMNYIRFWQADGESEKDSIRTKMSLGQLVEDTSIKAERPYGYILNKSGRLDKKKNEKKTLLLSRMKRLLSAKSWYLCDTVTAFIKSRTRWPRKAYDEGGKKLNPRAYTI